MWLEQGKFSTLRAKEAFSVSSKNRPKTHSSRARSHGPFTELDHGGLLSLLAQLSEHWGEGETRNKWGSTGEKKLKCRALLAKMFLSLDCSTHSNWLHLELNSRQKTHLRTIKWVDWMCIEVVKNSLSLCNKNQFRVNSSSSHTDGFTSGDYHDLYFNLLFDLFLVTDPWRMLAATIFCQELECVHEKQNW